MIFRIALLLVAAGAIRIVSTYWILNHVIDEPQFIASGLEWLISRTYTLLPEQPPLSHVGPAIGAWLAGTHNVPRQQGPHFLYHSPSYYRTLAAARAGELPFFIGAALIVWLWARRLHGDRVALAAVLLFTTMPVVLGHAGLATTDIALCGTLLASLYAFLLWVDKNGWEQSVLLGLAIAAGVLSKFSFLLYFPVCVLVITLIRRKWAVSLGSLVVVAAVAVFVIWAGYWFTFAPLFQGLHELSEHSRFGHGSYLFGELRNRGWWYFFPVVFAYKTPLAFLALAGLSVFWLRRPAPDAWVPFACAGAVLVSAMPSSINIGVRHVLPLYPLLAIPAGLAAVRLMESGGMRRAAGVGLVLWQLVASAAVHPDYIAYFNELAGGRPERVRVDSDLDWGQGFNELARYKEKRGIKEQIGLGIFGSVDPTFHGLGYGYIASEWTPSGGWVAISATERLMSDHRSPDGSNRRPWAWLDPYEPVARVGHGAILLYYVPREQR